MEEEDQLSTFECYRCHNLGSFQYEYLKMNKELNYAHMERHEEKRSSAWFLDSSCSNHMCSLEVMFSSIDKTLIMLNHCYGHLGCSRPQL